MEKTKSLKDLREQEGRIAMGCPVVGLGCGKREVRAHEIFVRYANRVMDWNDKNLNGADPFSEEYQNNQVPMQVYTGRA